MEHSFFNILIEVEIKDLIKKYLNLKTIEN